MSKNGGNNDADRPPQKPKRPPTRKAPSKYADAPYDVGKGKTPPEHRFKPGNPGGGRTKGSRNRSSLSRAMDEVVTIGHDALGRPIRRSLRSLSNRQLAKKCAEGDLTAIKHVNEFELKQAAMERSFGPPPKTADEVQKEAREAVEREKLSASLVQANIGILDMLAQLKKNGIVDSVDGVLSFNAQASDFLARLAGEAPDA
jgi:hypothetical protein